MSDRTQWIGHGQIVTTSQENHPVILVEPPARGPSPTDVVGTAQRLAADGSPAAILAFLQRDGSTLTSDGIGVLAGRGAERALAELAAFPMPPLSADQQQRVRTLGSCGSTLARLAERNMKLASSEQRSVVESTDLADTANRLISDITEAMRTRGVQPGR